MHAGRPLILAKSASGNDGLILPLIVPMIGVIVAVIGIFVVSPRITKLAEQRKDGDLGLVGRSRSGHQDILNART